MHITFPLIRNLLALKISYLGLAPGESHPKAYYQKKKEKIKILAHT